MADWIIMDSGIMLNCSSILAIISFNCSSGRVFNILKGSIPSGKLPLCTLLIKGKAFCSAPCSMPHTTIIAFANILFNSSIFFSDDISKTYRLSVSRMGYFFKYFLNSFSSISSFRTSL